MLESHSCSPQDAIIKVSFDAGGKFFKVCLKAVNISSTLQQTSGKRKSDFLSPGVKKLLMIALAEEISKNYLIISKIIQLTQKLTTANPQ